MIKKYALLIFTISILFLVSCDNPASDLSSYKPPFIKITLTKGGLLRAKQSPYEESNNTLSKKTNVVFNTSLGDEKYEVIYNFLKENNKNFSIFEKADIPYYHVIVAYISFKNKSNKNQIITIGDSWLAYYLPVDTLGETSNILYRSSKKKIDVLFKKLDSLK